jgi:hypothetical protein
VPEFNELYAKLKRSIELSGKSQSTLTGQEFIRRFALHILPKGFTRIRHFGIPGSALKKSIIPGLQQQPGKPELPERPQPLHRPCPVCRTGQLVTLVTFPPDRPLKTLLLLMTASQNQR